MPVLIAVVAAATVLAGRAARFQEVDTLPFLALEQVWNEAHLRGDTAALADLRADDLRIEVPGMSGMSKPEALAFWRSGRGIITGYRTSDLNVRLHADSVLVEGYLTRDRDFNGRAVTDEWRFQKTYKERGGRWRVTHYRAWTYAGSRTCLRCAHRSAPNPLECIAAGG